MEQIYTIPVNEVFDASRDKPETGCPLCALYHRLETDELDRILGASMMEPDIRIQTNHLGFCRLHYGKMLKMSNRLSMALTLESHLDRLREEIGGGALPRLRAGAPAVERIARLERDCYVCHRVETNFSRMVETAVLLWDADPAFREKFAAQPWFCLPHYRRLLEEAGQRLGRRRAGEFCGAAQELELRYFDQLRGDVSWFCKKFDYRFSDEPWYQSKDAIERAVAFLRSDPDRAGDGRGTDNPQSKT